jgi:hypothetical protein
MFQAILRAQALLAAEQPRIPKTVMTIYGEIAVSRSREKKGEQYV